MVHDRSSRRPLSGEQVTIAHGRYRADIATVGASLRTLTFAGRDLIAPFDADRVRPVYRGATLVPWPNRIASGRYVYHGRPHQLPVNEAERATALHGLGIWADWTVVSVTPSEATLEYRIPAQEGYPFDVLVRSSFALADDGLRWAVTAANLGDVAAPFGVASHAYLVAGSGVVDDWTVSIPAGEVLEVTEDRLLPVAVRDVAGFAGGSLDFRSPRLLGETFIDHAYTGLTAETSGSAVADGECRVELRSADGSGTAMVWDPVALPWLQAHTGDRPEPELHRSGLAVEPMSCPPDAFNSGTDLVTLEPGRRYHVSWRICALGEAR